jgi:Cys-tRNA(Pro) deacylase
MSAPRGPHDLQAFIDEHGIAAELLRLAEHTPTVETAAAAVGCRPEQIVKTILFVVDSQPVVAITSGLRNVERRVLAEMYGVGRKKVKLADSETVAMQLGYEVGGVPPFGHVNLLPVLMDESVLEHEIVYAGGGSDHALLKVAPDIIQSVTQAQVLDLHNMRSEA